MPSVTLRDLPPELHKQLKERAERNRRSLNSEILVALEQSIRQFGPYGGVRPSNEEILARAAENRETMKRLGITFKDDEEVTRFKNEGRRR